MEKRQQKKYVYILKNIIKRHLPKTKIKLVTIIENDGGKNFVVFLLQQKIRKVPHLVVIVSLKVSDLPIW